MIWLIFAVLTAGVVLAVTRSLRRPSAYAGARPSEIEAYKLQLEELDREEELGKLGKEEAQQTRSEVSRRLLRAGRQGAAASSKEVKSFSAAIAAFMIAAVIGFGSIGTYIYYGKPAAPDQPLEARLNAPLSEQTPDIQIANMERRLRRIQRIPPAGRPWRPYISGTVFSIKRRKPIRGRFTLAARTKTSFWGWWNLSRSQMTALFPMRAPRRFARR